MRRPLIAPLTHLTAPLKPLLLVLALVGTLAAPAAAGGWRHDDPPSSTTPERVARGADLECAPAGRVLEVLHGPVTTTLANPGSDGHQVGDLRTTSVPTTDASGAALGRLDATLTTVAVDVPEHGDEIRISTLVFVFGEEGVDQIVVGGSAVYPAQGTTLETGSLTTRPVQGGSGRFAGASGSALSEHLPDGTWRHTLYASAGGQAKHGPALGHLRKRGPTHSSGPDRLGHCARRLGLHILGEGFERLRQRCGIDPECSAILRLEAAADESGPRYPGLAGAPIDEPGITRTDLGRALPGSAPGQELGLWHYTIPVGAVLEPHTHAGTQIARVIRGELEYTIIAGDGTIISSDGTSTPVGRGAHVLRAGDSIVEDPDLTHFGANRGPSVVEIVAATLYPEGAPLSIPLATAAPVSLMPVPVPASPEPAVTSVAPVPAATPSP